MDKCCEVAALYLVTLRSVSIIAQQNHWLAKGANSYGNHLMFERIYNSATENLDLAAEKFIGLFGVECLDYAKQTELLNKVLNVYKGKVSDPITMSLSIEKDFLKLSQQAYDCFTEHKKMTLGLDDMIMSIASKREESIYLLQQNQG